MASTTSAQQPRPNHGDAAATTSATQSLWLRDDDHAGYPRLERDETYDVVVLGGGIAGATTALLLKQTGASVALVEAGRVGAGASGNNTAKVTALQSTVLSSIARQHGTEGAAVYAEASVAAVEQVAALVEEGKIDSDLRRAPAATFAADRSELDAVEAEAGIAREAGLPVELTDSLDLPNPVVGAVVLEDQLRLQPTSYVRGLAAALEGGGCRVLEGTRALGVSQGLAAPRRDLRGDGVGRARRGRDPLSAARPRALLRAHDRRALVLHRRADTGEAAAIALDQRGQPDPVDQRLRRPPDRRRRGPRERLAWGAHRALRGARGLRAAPLGRGRGDPPLVGAGPGAPRSPTDGRALPAALVDPVGRLGVHEVGPDERDLRRDDPARPGRRSPEPVGRADGPRPADAARPAGHDPRQREGRGRHGRRPASWDCPCHGSRFDVDGEVLEGPAVDHLERRSP